MFSGIEMEQWFAEIVELTMETTMEPTTAPPTTLVTTASTAPSTEATAAVSTGQCGLDTFFYENGIFKLNSTNFLVFLIKLLLINQR